MNSLTTTANLFKALSLPLTIITLLAATPVLAEQIDRSKSRIDDSLPAVTELNLAIPTEAANEQPQTSKQSNVKRRQTSITNEPASVTTKDPGKSTSGFRTKIAAVSPAPFSGNYLQLVNENKGTNDRANPIYTLKLYVNGQVYQTFDAISGTGRTQNRDRHTANTFAPLPDGTYGVSQPITSGIKEVGRTFIAITPKFSTGRSDLGIHLDPSFNQNNGSDGTAGCIGLTTVADRNAVNQFVAKYHPRNLVVNLLAN